MIEECKFYGYAFEIVPGAEGVIAHEVSFRTRKMGAEDTANLLTGREPQILSFVKTYAPVAGKLAAPTDAVVEGAVAAMVKHEGFLSELFDQSELRNIARVVLAGAVEASRG